VPLPGEEHRVPHVATAFAELLTAEAPSSIALSGGDTARSCYELLATAAEVAWSSVSVFFGDERWVPVHHPDSNEGMARLAFLDEVEPEVVHSMYAAGETIEAAAAAYHDLLRDEPPIELVHLGLGPDGHTASLFPGAPSLDVTDRLVVPTADDRHPHPRLTFTYPALARARLVVVTVAGASKREPLAMVRDGADVPAARVRAERVIWLVDPAAAGEPV
jgi:6-phosphogluconolactonase